MICCVASKASNIFRLVGISPFKCGTQTTGSSVWHKVTIRGLQTTQRKTSSKSVYVNPARTEHCIYMYIFFAGLAHGDYEWKDPETEDEVYVSLPCNSECFNVH
jgi:hypothetical protein